MQNDDVSGINADGDNGGAPPPGSIGSSLSLIFCNKLHYFTFIVVCPEVNVYGVDYQKSVKNTPGPKTEGHIYI